MRVYQGVIGVNLMLGGLPKHKFRIDLRSLTGSPPYRNDVFPFHGSIASPGQELQHHALSPQEITRCIGGGVLELAHRSSQRELK